jgi:hypothetical protein
MTKLPLETLNLVRILLITASYHLRRSSLGQLFMTLDFPSLRSRLPPSSAGAHPK